MLITATLARSSRKGRHRGPGRVFSRSRTWFLTLFNVIWYYIVMDQTTTAPGDTTTSQPSSVVVPAPPPGAVAGPIRATARQRAIIRPLPWDWGGEEDVSYATAHPYVRLYWTATIGPGAVADLLRLATAALRGRSLRRPTHLHVLVRVGLVHTHDGHIFVRTRVPPLNKIQVRLLPPDLRRRHPSS